MPRSFRHFHPSGSHPVGGRWVVGYYLATTIKCLGCMAMFCNEQCHRRMIEMISLLWFLVRVLILIRKHWHRWFDFIEVSQHVKRKHVRLQTDLRMWLHHNMCTLWHCSREATRHASWFLHVAVKSTLRRCVNISVRDENKNWRKNNRSFWPIVPFTLCQNIIT